MKIIAFLSLTLAIAGVLAKEYGDPCNAHRECPPVAKNLECNLARGRKGICECKDTHYLFENENCNLRLNFGDNCTNSLQCKNKLTCLATNQCGCTNDEFKSGETCENRRSFGVECLADNNCQASLTCLDSVTPRVCGCTEAQFRSAEKCENRRSFGGECSVDSECQFSLTCLTGRCGCTNLQFQSGDFCEKRRPIDAPCSDSTNCQNTLSCLTETEPGRCGCTEGQVESEGTCKNPIGGACLDDTNCQFTLTCLDSKECGCSDETFENEGGICERRRPIGEPCVDNTNCKNTLTCLTDSNKCGCIGGQVESEGTCRSLFGGVCSADSNCQATLICLGSKVCGCIEGQVESFEGLCRMKECPVNAQNEFNGRCYGGGFVTSWNIASSDCNLIKFDNVAEKLYIESFMNQEGITKLWVGAKSETTGPSAIYRWSLDNTIVDDSYFAPELTKQFTCLSFGPGGLVDTDCNTRLDFLCERDQQ